MQTCKCNRIYLDFSSNDFVVTYEAIAPTHLIFLYCLMYGCCLFPSTIHSDMKIYFKKQLYPKIYKQYMNCHIFNWIICPDTVFFSILIFITDSWLTNSIGVNSYVGFMSNTLEVDQRREEQKNTFHVLFFVIPTIYFKGWTIQKPLRKRTP